MKDTLNYESNVIKVEFFEPVNGVTEYYFGSMRAIYEMFDERDIGCTLGTLYVAGIVPDGRAKITKKCKISKHHIYRMTQRKE